MDTGMPKAAASCADTSVEVSVCTHIPIDAGPRHPFIVQTHDPDILAVRFWVRFPGEKSGHWCDVCVEKAEVMRAALAYAPAADAETCGTDP